MKRLAPLFGLAFSCLLFLIPVSAPAAEAPESRTIELEVFEDGQLVDAPSLKVQVGRTASVSVGGNYALRLRVDESAGAYVVRSTLYRPDQADWSPVAAPAATVTEGQSAQLRFGPLELALIVR